MDKATGREIETNEKGITKTTYRFITGDLRGMVRKVTETKERQTSVVKRYIYDEQGRRIRYIDKLGVVTIWNYIGERSKPTVNYALDDDPALVARRNAEEKKLLDAIAIANDPEKKEWGKFKLAMLYRQLKDESKMNAVADQIHMEPMRYFTRNHIVIYCSKTPQEKLEGFQRLLLDYPERAESILENIERAKRHIEKRNFENNGK